MQVSELPRLSQESKELLEAIGCLDAQSLVNKNPAALLAEVKKANSMLKIAESDPDLSEVQRWISTASSELEVEPVVIQEASKAEVADKVDIENNDRITHLLQVAPVAQKLNPQLIRDEKLAVSDIPEAILLTDCDGDLEINTPQGSRTIKELAAKETKSDFIKKEDPLAKKQEKRVVEKKRESSGFLDFEAANSGEQSVKPLERGEKLAVSMGSELNKGVKVTSRRFVKGVLHPDPSVVKIAAFFTILLQLVFVINLIGVTWLVILSLGGNLEYVVPISILLGLLALSFFFYLMTGPKARCRVCGQRQFFPKKCNKHKKAHYIPVIGYMLPTALQAIIYQWFYCIYCGTAVRLKK